MLEKMLDLIRAKRREEARGPMCVDDSSTHRLTSSVEIPALLNDPAPPKPSQARLSTTARGRIATEPTRRRYVSLGSARLAGKNDDRRRDWLDRRMFHMTPA